MATMTREREALIEKLKRAATSIYIAVDEAVARDISALFTEAAAALASPPAEDGNALPTKADAWLLHTYVVDHAADHDDDCPGDDTCDCRFKARNDAVGRCVRWLIERPRAAPAPPASDQPGPTVINEDDGDVTIDFDYANDRVVSIRLGEESSGLSAFVDGESHALCPLDRVPPKVLALLRTEAKAVTLRQSDPPGLVQLVKELADSLEVMLRHRHGQAHNGDVVMAGKYETCRLCEPARVLIEEARAYPLPASPQAKED